MHNAHHRPKYAMPVAFYYVISSTLVRKKIRLLADLSSTSFDILSIWMNLSSTFKTNRFSFCALLLFVVDILKCMKKIGHIWYMPSFLRKCHLESPTKLWLRKLSESAMSIKTDECISFCWQELIKSRIDHQTHSGHAPLRALIAPFGSQINVWEHCRAFYLRSSLCIFASVTTVAACFSIRIFGYYCLYCCFCCDWCCSSFYFVRNNNNIN